MLTFFFFFSSRYDAATLLGGVLYLEDVCHEGIEHLRDALVFLGADLEELDVVLRGELPGLVEGDLDLLLGEVRLVGDDVDHGVGVLRVLLHLLLPLGDGAVRLLLLEAEDDEDPVHPTVGAAGQRAELLLPRSVVDDELHRSVFALDVLDARFKIFCFFTKSSI